METILQAVALVAIVLGLVAHPASRAAIAGVVGSPLGRVVLGMAALAALLVYGIMLLISNVVGLPFEQSAIIFLGTLILFAAVGTCLTLNRFGQWSSGKTVGSVLFLIWLIFFINWEGSRAYLYATDLYQWSFLAKWGMFSVAWVAVAVAVGIWVTLVYKGPKVLVWAFVISSVLMTSFAIVDAAQFTSYRSPFSGEVMVKACVLPDGSSHPIPVGASFCREHPWVTEFHMIDLSNEDDQQMFAEWNGYKVRVGDSDQDIQARAECEKAKAAAKAAGAPVPNCSTTGMPAMEKVTSGLTTPSWLAESLGQSSEFPVRIDLSSGEDMSFNADLQLESQMGSHVKLMVCDGQEGSKLLVRNGSSANWAEQTQARVGVPISLVFDHGVKSGVRTVEVRYVGRGHINAVVGRGNVAMACDPGTTGALIGRVQDRREQESAEKAGAATP